MKKPEQQMWKTLQGLMAGCWDAQRHEDRFEIGIPDVSFAAPGISGWIELKKLPKWPSRDTAVLRVPHLYPEQVNWLETRGRWSDGCAWLLLAIGTPDCKNADWLVVPPQRVRELYDGTITVKDCWQTMPILTTAAIRESLLLVLKRRHDWSLACRASKVW